MALSPYGLRLRPLMLDMKVRIDLGREVRAENLGKRMGRQRGTTCMDESAAVRGASAENFERRVHTPAEYEPRNDSGALTASCRAVYNFPCRFSSSILHRCFEERSESGQFLWSANSVPGCCPDTRPTWLSSSSCDLGRAFTAGTDAMASSRSSRELPARTPSSQSNLVSSQR